MFERYPGGARAGSAASLRKAYGARTPSSRRTVRGRLLVVVLRTRRVGLAYSAILPGGGPRHGAPVGYFGASSGFRARPRNVQSHGGDSLRVGLLFTADPIPRSSTPARSKRHDFGDGATCVLSAASRSKSSSPRSRRVSIRRSRHRARRAAKGSCAWMAGRVKLSPLGGAARPTDGWQAPARARRRDAYLMHQAHTSWTRCASDRIGANKVPMRWRFMALVRRRYRMLGLSRENGYQAHPISGFGVGCLGVCIWSGGQSLGAEIATRGFPER